MGLKQPTVEVWRCRDLLITRLDGTVVWCRPGVIEYQRVPDHYWGGTASIYDNGVDDPRFVLTVDEVIQWDENALHQRLPQFGNGAQWATTGWSMKNAKIVGHEESGETLVLYAGRHALNYVAKYGIEQPPEPPVPDLTPYDDDEAESMPG